MYPGIDARINCAFKQLLGTERNKPLTVSFLNAALEPTGRPPVIAVEFLDTVQGRESMRGKESILDVRARDQLSRRYVVEMQMLNHKDLVKRLLYYWARGYTVQLLKGENYTALQPTILICILDQPLFADDGPFHRFFELRCKATGDVFSDAIEIHTIELSKLKDSDRANPTPIARWAMFLKDSEELNPARLPPELDFPEYHQAMETFIMMRENEETWLEYDAQRLKVMDDRARMRDSRAEGLEQGREQGRQVGRQEGIEIGERRGRLIGRILALQEILQIAPAAEDSLERETVEGLARIADELAERARSRRSGG